MKGEKKIGKRSVINNKIAYINVDSKYIDKFILFLSYKVNRS